MNVNMKKIYDLFPRTNGSFVPFKYGSFEKTHNIICPGKPFPSDEYVTVELPMVFYRYSKSNDCDRLQTFLERTRKHQQAIVDKECNE